MADIEVKTPKADAYILWWEVDHLTDEDYDAELVRFEGWEETYGLLLPESFDLPDRIEFEGNFRTLEKSSYPYNDVHWPIMSTRMLRLLRSIREFAHRPVEVVMLDDEGKQPPLEKEFSAVLLTEELDLIDEEKSELEKDPDYPDFILNIKKLVLRRPGEGPLPPLFRLSAYPTLLLVSTAARDAMEREGIVGVELQPLEEFHT